MFVVDRSPAAGDALDWVAAAVGLVTEEGAAGLEVGARTYPGASSCGVGPSVAPTSSNAAAVESTLLATSPHDELPLAAALSELDEEFSTFTERNTVVLMVSGDTRCADDQAAFDAVEALRHRGIRVYVLAVGFGTDNVFLQSLVNRAGTEKLYSASNQTALIGRLRDIIADVGVCCIDPDDDQHGPYCEAGADCNQLDQSVQAPSCEGAVCGDDGCGSSCGTCTAVDNGSAACTDGVCVPQCNDGFHACGDACADSVSPLSCGALCEPCLGTGNGVPACDAGVCAITCDPGFHWCGGECVDSTSTEHCGESCEPCASIDDGLATCSAGACGLGCNSGFKLCDGTCAVCPTEPGISGYTCDSDGCAITGCDDGFVACGDSCCSTLLVDVAAAGGPEPTSAYPSLVVSALGVPHIAYHRVTGTGLETGGEVRYATGALESWTTELVAEGANESSGSFTQIRLDGPGDIHIGFRGGDAASSAVIIDATAGASGWDTTTLAETFGAFPYQAGDFGFAVTQSGFGVAAYPSNSLLSFVNSTPGGSASTIASVDSAQYQRAPSMVISSESLATVLFVESDQRLRIATGGANVWTTETLDPNLGGLGQHRTDLRATQTGFQGCYFNSQPGAFGVYSVSQSGDEWTTELIDELGEQGCSVAVESTGLVHVTYRRQGGDLVRSTRYPVGWAPDVLHQATGPLGYRWPSAAVGKDGSFHAAYFDHDNGRLRYLYRP
ncbi:MAG: hypothetical protein ACI9OJ_001020 [Myxococcota bacterium]|jgi:hypothetical protein